MQFFLRLFATILFFSSSCAMSQTLLSIPDEKLIILSESEKWQKLIKLEEVSFQGKEDFAIHSQRFYLTRSEIITAKSELLATLSSFITTRHYSDINEHPQCRFPARFIWLKTKVDLSDVKPVACPNFQKWAKFSATKSLSLVFATGYLGNPASYYGHTLIKLNLDEKSDVSLLDTSINFGAEVPDNEDPLSYMIKGVIGGYDGSFTHSKYYYHTQNYLENELRDLWEYELNLDDEDYLFLVAHMWELIEQKYTYYFLDENCVFRMYELFSLIDGVEMPTLNSLWVIPQEVIRAINNAQYKQKPLVKETTYIPSRQAKFYDKYWQLNHKEQQFIADIVNTPTRIVELASFDITSKQKILSVLVDYYQYLIAIDEGNKKQLKQAYNSVLSYRFQIPMGKADFKHNEPISPDTARPSSYSQLSFANNDVLGNGVIFKLRPAYYDQLDAETGHVKNGALKMAELELDYFSSSLSLRSFSLFEVISVKNRASGLPYDSYDSWKLYLGLKKQNAICTDCTDLTLEAQKGWTIPIDSKTMFGFYIGGAFIENHENRGRAYTNGSITMNRRLTDSLNFYIDVEMRKYLENEYTSIFNYQAQMRYKYQLNKDYLDFRVSAKKDEISFGLGYYW